MKKQIFLSAVLTLMFCGVCLAGVVEHTEYFYVNDYAGVLSDRTRDYILKANDMIRGTGAEIVVTTVNFTDGLGVYDYALEMFNSWGIGDAQKHNGILLFLAVGEDDAYIIPGAGISLYMDDAEIDGIVGDYLADDFFAGEYDTAVMNTFRALLSRVEEIYVNNMPATDSVTGNNHQTQGGYIPQGAPQPRDDYAAVLSSGNLFGEFLSSLQVFVILIILVLIIVSLGGRRRYISTGIMPWYYPRRYYRPRHHHHHSHFGSHHGHGHHDGHGHGGHSPHGGGGMSRGGGAGLSGRGGGLFGGGRSSGGGMSRGGGAGLSGRGGGRSGGGGMSRGGGAGLGGRRK